MQKLAERELKPARIQRVRVEESIGFRGDPNLRISIVLGHREPPEITGRQAMELLRKTREFLFRGDDERFPHLQYLTTEDEKAWAAEDAESR